MKIIQVTSRYPPNIGGLQNCARELSERLAQKGHEVEVFTSDIGCSKGKLKSTQNLEIHYLKGFEFAHTPIIPSLLPRLLKAPKDSVIHVHVAKALVPEIVFLASKIRKIPYVAHFHSDVEPSGRLGFLLPLYKKVFLKQVLKSADRIIVLSEEYRNIISKKYNISEKTVVIPNGVSGEFFIDKKPISSKNINLLFVGRLAIQKNVPRLVRAASLVRHKVTLHIIGDGEEGSKIQKIISDKKMKNVILHGEKRGSELTDFYKSADIFLLPSDYEGLPLVLLEAMASGTPIIASDVRGISGLIGDVGVLVDHPTAEGFAKAIDALIENMELRKQLSQKGREKAKQYDWSSIVDKFENIYEEVLNENNKK